MDPNLLSIFLSFISFACFVMGAVLYLQGGGGISSKLFAAVAASAGLWIADLVIIFYQYSAAGYAISPFIFEKSTYAIGITIFYFFFLFSHSFPEDKLVIKKWFLVLSTAVTTLAMVFSFVPGAIVKYDEFMPGDYMSIVSKGPVYNFFYAPLIFFFLFWSIGKLITTYRKTKDNLDRLRLKYIITGFIISGFVGIVYDILSPYLSRPIGNFPVGHLSVFFAVSLTSYAILKYRLFNVKVIATELLTFSIWAFLLIRLFVAKTTEEIIVDGSLLVLIVVFGIILIKSVLKEVRQKEELEEKVQERTKELQQSKEEIQKRAEELEKFYKLTVGRELRMVELKKTIEELKKKL